MSASLFIIGAGLCGVVLGSIFLWRRRKKARKAEPEWESVFPL